MVYLAMLPVAQTEQGVCEMLEKISGLNSPYQKKKKKKKKKNLITVKSTNTYFLQYNCMTYLP